MRDSGELAGRAVREPGDLHRKRASLGSGVRSPGFTHLRSTVSWPVLTLRIRGAQLIWEN